MADSVILFLFGSAVGSFIGVLASRYDPDKKIFSQSAVTGRSKCDFCGKTLSWYELIPIFSFLLQRGRCASCKTNLSFGYLFLEIISGLAFAAVPYAISVYSSMVFSSAGFYQQPFWFYFLSLIYFVFVATIILISAIDVRLRIIPDQSSFLIIVLGAIVAWIQVRYGLFGFVNGSFLGHYAALAGFRDSIVSNRAVGALFGAIFFGAIFILSRGRGMGFGDVKLSIALGVFLGWPDIVLSTGLAFIIGALWSIILMLGRSHSLKSKVPFGPFIALGVFLVMVVGQQIMDWYFRLFP